MDYRSIEFSIHVKPAKHSLDHPHVAIQEQSKLPPQRTYFLVLICQFQSLGQRLLLPKLFWHLPPRVRMFPTYHIPRKVETRQKEAKRALQRNDPRRNKDAIFGAGQ